MEKTSQLWGKWDFSGKYNEVTFVQLLFHLSLQKKVIVPIFEQGLENLLPLKVLHELCILLPFSVFPPLKK